MAQIILSCFICKKEIIADEAEVEEAKKEMSNEDNTIGWIICTDCGKTFEMIIKSTKVKEEENKS